MSLPTTLTGKNEPVAIVGMGCRFSGGVKDPPGLWNLLRNKRDGWREFKNPRFPSDGFYHPNQDRPGSIRTKGAFLCDDDAREFDHAFFGITGREAETMDPSQRKLLEVVYEAFENAGETWDSISGTRTGVYIGMFALDHVLMQSREWDYTKPYAATGAETSILANRISYVFNLHGPSLATNTACSSSMYAPHLAVSAIRSGDCDGAIVAAANWIQDPSMQIVLDKLGALSPTSRCHTFDAAADGYARGEGFAAIYLKKSDLALLEGTPIRAMIRGTGVNANGKTGGITRPSAKGQEDAIRKAFENAGNLPLEDTTFFECHGTGTPAGDPLEVSAVGSVFASSRRSDAPEDRLLIGSIKPNLGHTEGASALASIMKVVLSLEAGEIAPTCGIERLNPNIDFDAAKVLVVKDEAVPWPKGKVRRASVNSFGFGGANGNCIIDHVNEVLPGYAKPGVVNPKSHVNGHHANGLSNGSGATIGNGHVNGNEHLNGNGHVNGNGSTHGPKHTPMKPELVRKTASATASARRFVLLPFSAHNASSLTQNIDTLAQSVAKKNQWTLADIAYTLGSKRSRFQQRTFRIVDTTQVDAVAVALADEGRVFTSPIQTSNVGFIFTGQGAQWHAMGGQLFEYGVFRSTISHLDHVLDQLRRHSRDPSSWTIAATLTGDCEPEHIQSPHVSQVACTAMQIGLVDLLASWSISPRAVAGHSSGEMGAAYAGGYLTAAEAIAAAYFRGQAVATNKQKGAMLAVGMGVDDVARYLEGREEHVRVAAMNSPGSVTLSGDADAIDVVSRELSTAGIFNRTLKTSGSAYHSHHMVSVGGAYIDMLRQGQEVLQTLGLADEAQRYPRVTWASSVKPDKAFAHGDDLGGPHYWRENLESPVRFTQAVTKLMNLDGQTIDVLLEVGPHGALKGPIEQTLKGIGKPVQYATTLTRNEDGRRALLQLAGTLFATNAEIDLAAVNSVDAGDAQDKLAFVHGCVAVDLPTYQYSYGPVSYYESRMSKEFRLRDHLRHDLLGSNILGASKLLPQWRNVLRVKDVPWLADHRLVPDAVFPAAGYIALGIEAATRVHQALPGARQITGYSIRDVNIDVTLRIPEDDHGVKTIVGAELVDQSTAEEPSWLKFTVTSVSRASNEWAQHCVGLVKVEVAPAGKRAKLSTEMDPRYPSVAAWYDQFTSIGLGYGKSFQPLSDLRADPHRGLAQAKVVLNSTAGSVGGGESSYPLHPAALDATFQLAIIAIFGGQLEQATAAFVPVHISQLYLKAGVRHDAHATAVARSSAHGLRDATSKLQMVDESGDVFLDVGSMRFTELKGTKKKSQDLLSKQPFSSPFSRLAWKPDIRTISSDRLRDVFPPPAENADLAAALEVLETICVLVAFDIYDSFVTGSKEKISPKGDIRHWLAWIKRLVDEDDPRSQVVEAKRLSPQHRRELLEDLYAQAGDRPEAQAARLLHENAAEILSERRTGIDVLISHKLFTPLYEVGTAIAGSHPQVSNVMDLLAHANPHARILEIGAGTGAATRAAMRSLVGSNGIKRFSDYTFTDISAGFLASAKEMLSEVPDVRYAVLDVEQDPLEHGYEPVYDIVLACEAIHATESMDRTLAHCRSLLKPGGKLVLVETTRMRVLLGLLYGTLTGYWQSDDRTEGPFMNLETWQRRLTSTGFSGVDLHVDDYEAPHNTTSVLVTTRLDDEKGSDAKTAVRLVGEVHLLHDGVTTPAVLKQLITELEHRRVTVRPSKFPPDGPIGEAVPEDARVIVLLSDKNDLFDADAGRLQSFQYLSRSTKSMVWLIAGDIKGESPRGAFMTGLLRVIATENPAGRFLSINVEGQDGFEQTGSNLAKAVVDKEVALQQASKEGLEDNQESSDTEFVWQDGCLWVSRVVPDTELGEYAEVINTPSRQGHEVLHIDGQGPVRAAFETPGILNSLYFRSYAELLRPLPDDHVEVKIAAVGLNSRDVAIATGRSNNAGSSLSSEYAGVVIKVGAAVKHLAPGDRVFGVGSGNLGNFEHVPAAFAQKLDADKDLVESATMPFSFMSAVYAFEHVARLRKGHRVLVLGAAGDIGLAAIQVAQLKGTEVFAVVDGIGDLSPLPVVATSGVARDRVFSLPQDYEPLQRAARSAHKQGFNVILNTTAERDTLHRAMHLLAPGGHLIQVGRDGLDDLQITQKDITLSSFGLSSVLTSDPELGQELMETVHNLRQAGQITPIRPISVSSVADLDQTLVDMSKKTPTGKVVISFQDPEARIKVLSQPQPATFDPEARYIITGGFGGLGRGVIRWMAGRGAQDFVVLSRRAAQTPSARLLIDDMKAQGVQVEAVACDVSHKDQVQQAISNLTAVPSQRPIRGIVHAVLSLSDLTFDKLTIDKWRAGTAAKTHGTVNLHEATLAQPLDFFVLLTSTETIWAPATQSAYIAADYFAAYFARFRRAQGLPASAVSYGFVSDLGSDYRATSHGTEDMYARNLVATMTEAQALAALEPAFLTGRAANAGTKKCQPEEQHDPLSDANLFTCLSPLALAGPSSSNSTHVPRWHRDGRVSGLLRAVGDAKRHALDEAAAGELDGEGADGTAGLRRAFDEAVRAGPDGREVALALVADGIVGAISEMLFIDPGSVNPARSAAEHGVDSLIAAELRSWFHQALGADVRNLLDSRASIRRLAGDIVDKALAGGE